MTLWGFSSVCCLCDGLSYMRCVTTLWWIWDFDLGGAGLRFGLSLVPHSWIRHYHHLFTARLTADCGY